MAYDVAIVVGLVGLMFWLTDFMRSLEHGKHDTLKFFLASSAFIIGTQVIAILLIIANNNTETGIANILGTTYWYYSTLLAAIVLYFVFMIGKMLIDYVQNRDKNKIQEPLRFK